MRQRQNTAKRKMKTENEVDEEEEVEKVIIAERDKRDVYTKHTDRSKYGITDND